MTSATMKSSSSPMTRTPTPSRQTQTTPRIFRTSYGSGLVTSAPPPLSARGPQLTVSRSLLLTPRPRLRTSVARMGSTAMCSCRLLILGLGGRLMGRARRLVRVVTTRPMAERIRFGLGLTLLGALALGQLLGPLLGLVCVIPIFAWIGSGLCLMGMTQTPRRANTAEVSRMSVW
ncbi:hypothetical protein EDB81DRAFT_213952 [Dactylonectria macrodidyma]|uniref:Uncharacterized protein n=1 Tax=Dactylonectria macrodidyma TaxID=307937 RepID=A0A9P9DR02_9HYPO|nr:hypothetical protein EDB81DRAFT_213952 [Dactylonectria macrodidyma]